MRTVTDQMGRTVTLPDHPSRIISLVPSQTEFLFDLGLKAEIVGLTTFCIHPAAQTATKPTVGGTKQLNLDRIHQLQPDLIIGNKEENERDSITELAQTYPVWLSDIYTLDDALTMMTQIGTLVHKQSQAIALSQQITAAFAHLTPTPRPIRVGYFIWQKPYMVAGQHTFIHDMLTRCGFINAFATLGNGRYPSLTLAQIQAAHLDAILLSSEPFPFAEKHRASLAAACPQTAVHLVDGELFSWYGSRLRHAPSAFQQLLTALKT